LIVIRVLRRAPRRGVDRRPRAAVDRRTSRYTTENRKRAIDVRSRGVFGDRRGDGGVTLLVSAGSGGDGGRSVFRIRCAFNATPGERRGAGAGLDP